MAERYDNADRDDQEQHSKHVIYNPAEGVEYHGKETGDDGLAMLSGDESPEEWISADTSAFVTLDDDASLDARLDGTGQ